jgi:hypothetical protein
MHYSFSLTNTVIFFAVITLQQLDIHCDILFGSFIPAWRTTC